MLDWSKNKVLRFYRRKNIKKNHIFDIMLFLHFKLFIDQWNAFFQTSVLICLRKFHSCSKDVSKLFEIRSYIIRNSGCLKLRDTVYCIICVQWIYQKVFLNRLFQYFSFLNIFSKEFARWKSLVFTPTLFLSWFINFQTSLIALNVF